MPLTDIKCPTCGCLFGREDETGTLHVKFKDLYREVSGRISGPCRKCSMTVVWPNESQVVIIERRG